MMIFGETRKNWETDALVLLALSAATLAPGGVYWAVREQDRAMRTTDDNGAS